MEELHIQQIQAIINGNKGVTLICDYISITTRKAKLPQGKQLLSRSHQGEQRMVPYVEKPRHFYDSRSSRTAATKTHDTVWQE